MKNIPKSEIEMALGEEILYNSKLLVKVEELSKENNKLNAENIMLKQKLEVKEDILQKCNHYFIKIAHEIGKDNFDMIIKGEG